jgi:hypothetical protein
MTLGFGKAGAGILSMKISGSSQGTLSKLFSNEYGRELFRVFIQ